MYYSVTSPVPLIALVIDGTEVKNEEERPLFTVYLRNSMVTKVVILRAVLTNNKRWVFRWICEVVIPNLL